MTRISDLGLQQTMLHNFQRLQDAAFERQTQASSGKIATAYSGVGAATNRLLSAEGVAVRARAYEDAATVALSRLQVQEAAVASVAEVLGELRQRLVVTLATGAPELIMPEAETAAQRILAALNTQSGGVYVFGGSDGTVRPAAAASLAEIGAAPVVEALFVASATRTRLAVEEGVTIDGGPAAAEFAGDVLEMLRDFAGAEAALGPFAGDLTAGQRDFLVEKVAELDAIAADLNVALGLNGVAQSQASAAKARNVERRDLAEIVASEIEDIDIAEIVTKLAQDRLAIEASARALAQATQLSLLNYI